MGIVQMTHDTEGCGPCAAGSSRYLLTVVHRLVSSFSAWRLFVLLTGPSTFSPLISECFRFRDWTVGSDGVTYEGDIFEMFCETMPDSSSVLSRASIGKKKRKER